MCWRKWFPSLPQVFLQFRGPGGGEGAISFDLQLKCWYSLMTKAKTIPVVFSTCRITLLWAIAAVWFEITLCRLVNAVSTATLEWIPTATAGWRRLHTVDKTDIIQSYIAKSSAGIMFCHYDNLYRKQGRLVRSTELHWAENLSCILFAFDENFTLILMR